MDMILNYVVVVEKNNHVINKIKSFLAIIIIINLIRSK